jgi:predicted metalloprotease with PDZ domain
MRFLYWQYYKKLQRGFTDAEFQEACETIAGHSLNNVFEYVYTTKPVEYNSHLIFAGLQLKQQSDSNTRKFSFQLLESITESQQKILHSWLDK